MKFSSDDAASRVYAIGEGEGTTQKVAIADDVSSIEAGYPRYEKSASYKGVKVHSTLVSHAHSLLEENRNPLTDISITIRGNDDPYVGSTLPETGYVLSWTIFGSRKATTEPLESRKSL